MSVATASYDLADACDALVDQINTMRNAPGWTETPEQMDAYNQLVFSLLEAADNARTSGVAASLEEAPAPLARLAEAVQKAKAAVARLQTIDRVISLAGSVLSLAAAAATGNLGGIAKSVAAIAKNVNGLG